MTAPGEAVAKPMLDWATLTVGERFGPMRWEVDPGLVATYRQAVDDHDGEAVAGEAVAPAALLTFPVLQLTEHHYRARPGTIHAAQDFDLLAPVRVGATLEVTGVLTAMELRRGRRYFTVESTLVDDRGVTVARARMTGVYPPDAGDAEGEGRAAG